MDQRQILSRIELALQPEDVSENPCPDNDVSDWTSFDGFSPFPSLRRLPALQMINLALNR